MRIWCPYDCSLPSALAQHRHSEGGDLFPLAGIDKLLPAAAITVGIPLLEMNEVHGTTAVWLGTHRDVSRSNPYAIQVAPIRRQALSPSCARAHVFSGISAWCTAGPRTEAHWRAN